MSDPWKDLAPDRGIAPDTCQRIAWYVLAFIIAVIAVQGAWQIHAA